ncbi:MAG: S26 family signal peptidase [Thermoplasmata archaeon]
MEDLKKELFLFGKDILIAFIIIGIILSALFTYSGRWPPMVVIESSSMSHSEESQIGLIDTGDIVIVRTSDRDDIVTYLEGRADGYSKYGQYGDVIIYRPMGSISKTPIIHRPVMYLELNESGRSFDIPALGDLEYGEDWACNLGEHYRSINGTVTIYDYGFREAQVRINLGQLILSGYNHSGYITMGDNNVSPQSGGHYDQGYGICPAPIKDEWVEGKARGELPWFGIMKLAYMDKTREVPSNSWNNLAISLVLIVGVPLGVDVAYEYFFGEEEEKEEGEEEKSGKDQPVKKKKRIKKKKISVEPDEEKIDRADQNKEEVRTENIEEGEETE